MQQKYNASQYMVQVSATGWAWCNINVQKKQHHRLIEIFITHWILKQQHQTSTSSAAVSAETFHLSIFLYYPHSPFPYHLHPFTTLPIPLIPSTEYFRISTTPKPTYKTYQAHGLVEPKMGSLDRTGMYWHTDSGESVQLVAQELYCVVWGPLSLGWGPCCEIEGPWT